MPDDNDTSEVTTPVEAVTTEEVAATAVATNKGGAPRGNKNAMKHGKHARFPLGLMPKRLKGVERSVGDFRRIVEQAVLDARGTITVLEAAHITSAAKWERHSQLMTNWLRNKYAELSHENLLKFSRETARASSERDRCLTALRLDTAGDDVWVALYDQPRLTIATMPSAAIGVRPPEADAIDVASEPVVPPSGGM